MQWGSQEAEAESQHLKLRGLLGSGRATAPSAPWPTARRHKPGPHVFKQNVKGDQGARSCRPPLPHESPVLGAAREATRSAGGCGVGRGVEDGTSLLQPLGPGPPDPPAAPILRATCPPGTARCKEGGDPRASPGTGISGVAFRLRVCLMCLPPRGSRQHRP